ncbi:hypothetical protein G6F68_011736 [Rhizopus microsporus]|nr:hypothetical protein G6F68_011736 [Rhizopus microsporus]
MPSPPCRPCPQDRASISASVASSHARLLLLTQDVSRPGSAGLSPRSRSAGCRPARPSSAAPATQTPSPPRAPVPARASHWTPPAPPAAVPPAASSAAGCARHRHRPAGAGSAAAAPACEPRVRTPPGQKAVVHRATGGIRAVGIEGAAGVALTPGVHQRVGRAGIEAARRLAGRQQRDVGDAAQIEDGAAMLRAEDRGVEWRHQRCTLAACGHVAAAEVRHHVDAGQFRQQGRRIELHGIAAVRPVPDGLAVRADGGHGIG